MNLATKFSSGLNKSTIEETQVPLFVDQEYTNVNDGQQAALGNEVAN